MTTHEPSTDRDGWSAPTGADHPARSVVVPAGPDPDSDPDSDSESAPEPAPEEDSGRGWGRDLLLIGGTCLLLLLVVNAFVARPFAVPSGSMENTLRPGDRVVANELAYAFGGHVRRGDVVVFDGTGSFLPYADEPSA
ncbi:S26 family signal peptidase [Kitasatospora arboriphila]